MGGESAHRTCNSSVGAGSRMVEIAALALDDEEKKEMNVEEKKRRREEVKVKTRRYCISHLSIDRRRGGAAREHKER